ncbi:MAG: hypothetical protein V8T36_12590 [Ruthenibacterium lactatiformans]
MALRPCEQQDVLVVNGDTFFDVDLDALAQFHAQTGAVDHCGQTDARFFALRHGGVLRRTGGLRISRKAGVRQRCDQRRGVLHFARNALDGFPRKCSAWSRTIWRNAFGTAHSTHSCVTDILLISGFRRITQRHRRRFKADEQGGFF